MSSILHIRLVLHETIFQFCQNLYMIKKESSPNRPKFCRSGSAVQHLFWRLIFIENSLTIDILIEKSNLLPIIFNIPAIWFMMRWVNTQISYELNVSFITLLISSTVHMVFEYFLKGYSKFQLLAQKWLSYYAFYTIKWFMHIWRDVSDYWNDLTSHYWVIH